MPGTIILDGKAAFAHAKRCVEEPGKYQNDPRTIFSAQHVWNSMGEYQHQCYWNDRFAVAVMCNMSEADQRVAAWAAVSNALIGYWEWMTHGGFDMVAVLKHLEIVPADFSRRELPGRFYSSLDHSLCRAIVEKFNLPTNFYEPSRDLTEEEEKLAEAFSSRYPQYSPLSGR